jgi:hypothetical protein
MDIIKYVKKDGSGDYTDLFVAFNDMLASGLAATGSIRSYLMLVDGGTYSGTFSGYIPYTGFFDISASGARVYITEPSTVSGDFTSIYTPNLSIENILFDCQNTITEAFTINSGICTLFKNSEFIRCDYGFNMNGGSIILDGVSSHGNATGYFIMGSGHSRVQNSQISNYNYGIYLDNITVKSSKVFNNEYNILSTYGHNTVINGTLIYGGSYGVYALSGVLGLSLCTIDSTIPIYSEDANLFINSTIMKGTSYCIDGTYQTGSIVENSCIYPSGWVYDPNLTSLNISTSDPLFNNTLVGDYRLKFGDSNGSPYVEFIPNLVYASGVSIEVEQAQFRVYDEKGKTPLNEFLAFVYKQGNSIVFTDYNREIMFAKLIGTKNALGYQQQATFSFTETNVPTRPSFGLNENDPDIAPYDWDWVKIPSTQIQQDREYYLIPRSIIDIESIANDFLGVDAANVLWNTLSKRNIKVYDQINYKGVSYDSKQSDVGISILWILDGQNQMLIKQNAFSGEEIQKYPLLCSPTRRSVVRPSGMIHVSVDNDRYRFILESDPNKEVLAESSFGDVPWIPTHMNNMTDLRGILAFKDHLLITGSQYYESINDRNIIASGDSNGILYLYPSNDLFYNYIKNPGDINGPVAGVLGSGNFHPTDITAYEDGTILVADAFKPNIYRYKLAYDYALVQNSYDSETRVILREKYEDINI